MRLRAKGAARRFRSGVNTTSRWPESEGSLAYRGDPFARSIRNGLPCAAPAISTRPRSCRI
jgi:hypothetical protein